MLHECEICQEWTANFCKNPRCLQVRAHCPEPDCEDGTLIYDDGIPHCVDCGQEAFWCTKNGVYMGGDVA